MAIARGNTSEGETASGASVTFSHTVASGSNRLLLVGVERGDGITITGITYDGVALSELVDDAADFTGRRGVWGLLSPNVGTANIVVSFSGTTASWCGAADYTGVLQSGLPDDTATDAIVSGVNTQADLSFTTTVDDCWSFCITEGDNGSVGGVTNATELQQNGTDRIAIFDSNGSLGSAGSKTMSTTCAVNSNGGSVGVTFAPYVQVRRVMIIS